MSYSFRYINKQVESSYTSYSLIIEDIETDEYYRFEKCFKEPKSQIDSEFLISEAQKEIRIILDSKLNLVEEQNGNINE